jgi:hypothetical protein
LLPNNLILVINHGDDEEDVPDTKDMLESPRDMHTKVEIQSNSKFQSLTLSPTHSLGLPCFQIDVQDVYKLRFGCYTYARKEDDIYFPLAPVPSPNKIGFD